MREEEWRWLPSDDAYEVSSEGRVRSYRRNPPRLIWGGDQDGYRRIVIRGRKRYFHDMVAEAFLGPRPDGLDVCHLNGIRWDNRVANLRYGTRKENVADARRHGTLMAGEGHYASILTWAQVREIRALWATRELSQYKIAERFGVSRSCVQAIIENRNWKEDGGEAIREKVLG